MSQKPEASPTRIAGAGPEASLLGPGPAVSAAPGASSATPAEPERHRLNRGAARQTVVALVLVLARAWHASNASMTDAPARRV
jgi:hypothetical protein